jgi:hypothetical protein
MLVEVANGGTMSCAKLCKNLQWKMQGVQFQADVFVMALQNYDMVLDIVVKVTRQCISQLRRQMDDFLDGRAKK